MHPQLLSVVRPNTDTLQSSKLVEYLVLELTLPLKLCEIRFFEYFMGKSLVHDATFLVSCTHGQYQ